MKPNANKQALKKAIQICLFIVISQAVSAQIKISNNETRKLYEEASEAYMLRDDIDAGICNEYSTITIHVRNKKVQDSVDFSRNPKIIKIAFFRSLSVYKKANWGKIIPKSPADFDILQPFNFHYYPDTIANCPDPLSSNQIKEMLDADIKSRKNKKIPTYLFDPMKLWSSAPVSRK
ncbi:hypothetical protein CLV51_103303 [Chitinophaga niastensis]|uniref:Uncharacterized protein n=1 Tax=Chitinophaga niastensis TaxID=536980 RepID=A0A2P8HJF0_CHINA|nr:hypothetical protein [Chitinophaga niastensis]PSL46325.1 hypothetical protein CLV51_103303 [Chitinophaga niastensis]